MEVSKTKSPKETLGIAGQHLSHELLQQAYEVCKLRYQESESSYSLEHLKEIEWAYRALCAELEAVSSSDEDVVISADLIPGLGSLAGLRPIISDGRRAGATLAAEPAQASEPTFLPNPIPSKKNEHENPGSAVGSSSAPPTAHGSAFAPARALSAANEEVHLRLLNLVDTCQHVTGALLRQLREEMGISVTEIHLRTKIMEKYLVAIEEDDYDLLPAPVYFRGFIVSYLNYLGVKRKDVVDNLTNQFCDRLKNRMRGLPR